MITILKDELSTLRQRKMDVMLCLEKQLTTVYTSQSAMFKKVKNGLERMTIVELESLSLLIMYQND